MSDRSSWSRRLASLGHLTLCRAKEFVREPEAVFWVFLFPVLLAVSLGLAFREKAPDKIPVGVIAETGIGTSNPSATALDPAGAAALAALQRSPQLAPRAYTEAAGREALRTGRISLLVVPGSPGKPARVILDETRPDARTARLEAEDALQRAAGRKDPLQVGTEKLTEPGARYIDFLIPGLLGLNLMGTGIWSLTFSIAVARQRRVLKRLVATPMHKADYLLSQILGRMIFLIPELIILIGFGWIAFGVAVHGSILLLLLTSLLAAMSFCGLGLLTGSRVSTMEGASGLGNMILLPMWLLSGTFFSSERFPDAVQPFIKALPLTALNQALRAIINEGHGLAEIWPQLTIVAAWGFVSFVVALKIFKWK
ncbi:MAG TPA: ABC transporter permease [Thermoanaerobaculia bacterium]|nr:ABC transporter permease [Thermoanaerobaculia bacterium]